MDWSELPRICSEFTEAMIRRPGIPPSTCRGEIIRVGPDLKPIGWDEAGVLDDCLPGEGELHQKSEIRLFACLWGGNALVVARGTDGKFYLRNEWQKPPTDASPATLPLAVLA